MPSSMVWMKSLVSLIAAVAIFAGMVGCSGEPASAKKYPVSGTVTLDGQPMPAGVIFFRTVSSGSLDRVDIVGGAFKGEAEAGARRVEICQYQTVTMGEGEMQTENQVNVIPERFNTNTTLTAEVTTSGANDYQFDVQSK